MISYYKKKLIDDWQIKIYDSFELTLDTPDFVREKHLKKIQNYIFKYAMQQKRRINAEDRAYQKVRKLLIEEGLIPDTTSRDAVKEDCLEELEENKSRQENSTEEK